MFVTLLAICAGMAAAAGLALQWLAGRPSSGLGVPVALAALVVAAVALATWVGLRRSRDDTALQRLPTIVLAPEPHSPGRAAPPVLRVALPSQRTGVPAAAPGRSA